MKTENFAKDVLFRGFTPCKTGETVIVVNDTKYKGEWVYGSFVRLGEKYYIIPCDEINNSDSEPMYLWMLSKTICGIIPETVGQYVGLRDKTNTKEFPEGQRIFTGDICSFIDFFDGSDMETYCEGEWKFGDWDFYITDRLSAGMGDLVYNGRFDGYVLGNIFSTPEDFKGHYFIEENLTENDEGEKI